MWYKKDDVSTIPKAIVSMKLYTHDCEFGVSLKGVVFSNLWSLMMSECLREFNAACNNANVYTTLFMTLDNLDLQWSGFSDSMPNLIGETISRILIINKQNDLEEIFN